MAKAQASSAKGARSEVRPKLGLIFAASTLFRAFSIISRFQRWILSTGFTWADGPGRGPQPSISAGVQDYYISRLWRLEWRSGRAGVFYLKSTWNTTSVYSNTPLENQYCL